MGQIGLLCFLFESHALLFICHFFRSCNHNGNKYVVSRIHRRIYGLLIDVILLVSWPFILSTSLLKCHIDGYHPNDSMNLPKRSVATISDPPLIQGVKTLWKIPHSNAAEGYNHPKKANLSKLQISPAMFQILTWICILFFWLEIRTW